MLCFYKNHIEDILIAYPRVRKLLESVVLESIVEHERIDAERRHGVAARCRHVVGNGGVAGAAVRREKQRRRVASHGSGREATAPEHVVGRSAADGLTASEVLQDPRRIEEASPEIGEHTEEVLSDWASLTQEEIEELTKFRAHLTQ